MVKRRVKTGRYRPVIYVRNINILTFYKTKLNLFNNN